MDLLADEKCASSGDSNENDEANFFSAVADNTRNVPKCMNFAAFAEKSGISNFGKAKYTCEFSSVDASNAIDLELPSILKKDFNNITSLKRSVHFGFPVASTKYYVEDDNESTASTELLFSDDEEGQTPNVASQSDQEVPVNDAMQEPSNKRIKLDDLHQSKFIPTFNFPEVISIPTLNMMNTNTSYPNNSTVESEENKQCNPQILPSSSSQAAEMSLSIGKENDVTIISETPPIDNIDQAVTNIVSPVLKWLSQPINEFVVPIYEVSNPTLRQDDTLPTCTNENMVPDMTGQECEKTDQGQMLSGSQVYVVEDISKRACDTKNVDASQEKLGNATTQDQTLSDSLLNTLKKDHTLTQLNEKERYKERFSVLLGHNLDIVPDLPVITAGKVDDIFVKMKKEDEIKEKCGVQIVEKIDTTVQVKEKYKRKENYASVEHENSLSNAYTFISEIIKDTSKVNNAENNDQPSISNEIIKQEAQNTLFDTNTVIVGVSGHVTATTDGTKPEEVSANTALDQLQPHLQVHDEELAYSSTDDTTGNEQLQNIKDILNSMIDEIVLLNATVKNEHHETCANHAVSMNNMVPSKETGKMIQDKNENITETVQELFDVEAPTAQSMYSMVLKNIGDNSQENCVNARKEQSTAGQSQECESRRQGQILSVQMQKDDGIQDIRDLQKEEDSMPESNMWVYNTADNITPNNEVDNDFKLIPPDESDGFLANSHNTLAMDSSNASANASCIMQDGAPVKVQCNGAVAKKPHVTSGEVVPETINEVPAVGDSGNGYVHHPHLCSSIFHLDEGALLTEITLSPLKISDCPNKMWLPQQTLDFDNTSFYHEDANYDHDKCPFMPSLQCLAMIPEVAALPPVECGTAPHLKEYFQYADIDTESCSSQISDFTVPINYEMTQTQSHTQETTQPAAQITKDRKMNDTVQGVSKEDDLETQLKHADDLDGPELLHLAMQLVETALKKTKKPAEKDECHQQSKSVPVITPKTPSPAFTWKKFTYQSQLCNVLQVSSDEQNEQDAKVPDAPKQFNQFSKLYLNNSCTRPIRLGLSRRQKGSTSTRHKPYATTNYSINTKTECHKYQNMEKEFPNDFWKCN